MFRVKIRKAVFESTELFTKVERIQLTGFIFLQVVISTLDIFAVVLSGALSLQVLQIISGSNTEEFLPTAQLFVNMPSERRLLIFSILTFTFFVLRTLCSILVNRVILNYLSRKTATLSQTLLRDFFNLPLNRQQNFNSQGTLYAITDGVDRAILGTLGTAIVISVDFISTIFLILVMFIVSPGLALCFLIYFAISIYFLNRYSNTRISKYGTVKVESNIEIRNRFILTQNNYRELFLSSKILNQIGEIAKLKRKSTKATADQILVSNLNKYIFETVVILAFVIFLGFQSLVSNSMPSGSTVGILGASILRLIPNLLRLHQGYLEIRTTQSEASTTLKLIKDLSKLSVELGDNSFSGKVLQHKTPVVVKFEKASFAYDARFKISESNFKFTAPELVAIIGPNGSGKSTLLDLIAGVLVPTYGSVSINDIQARNFALEYPGAISYVPQDINMFGSTLSNNLHLSSEEVPNDLESKYFDFFDLGLTSDTTILNLSGGQKQRLSLTRASLNNSSIILLDEPTSALDAKGEKRFQEWLKMAKSDKLIFIVAHRIDTIKQADSVIYIEKGMITHIGNLEASQAYVSNLQSNSEIF